MKLDEAKNPVGGCCLQPTIITIREKEQLNEIARNKQEVCDYYYKVGSLILGPNTPIKES